MLNAKKYWLFAMVVTLLIESCAPSSNKEKIVGTWETVPKSLKAEESFSNYRSTMKVVLKFRDDLSIESRMYRNGKEDGVYNATYDFENDQKSLVVYREGKKSRKNVASIIKLTGSEMVLVDVSGSGDTLQLRKVK
jgi:hypothetical protein